MVTKTKFIITEADTTGGLVREKPRIDEVKGIVYDVKVLGKKSKNGKEYLPTAIKDAVRLCEGAISYVDHPTKDEEELGGRLASKRFGRLIGMYIREGEAYCKQYRFNPQHPFAGQFIWQVKNDPNGIGLSYNGLGSGYIRNGIKIIENLTKRISVDLVDNPGTTMSLFEQDRSNKVGKIKVKEQNDVLDAAGTTTVDDTADHESHLVEAIKALADSVKEGSVDKEDVKAKINAILDMLGGGEETSEPSEVVEQLKSFDNKLMNSAASIISDKIIIREQLDERIKTAKDAGLKDEHITEQFKKQLLNADDEDELKEIIDDRRKLVGITKKPIANPPKKAKVKVIEQSKNNNDNSDDDKVEDLSKDKLKELSDKVFNSEDL
jgi:hypothetical protein